jgi:hypothetical protein
MRDKYGDDLQLLLMEQHCKNHYKREEEKIYIGKGSIDHVGTFDACRKHRQKTDPHAKRPENAKVLGRAALYNPHYKRDVPERQYYARYQSYFI